MAEVILGSVADSIAGKLVSLVSEEIGQASGVKEELIKLQHTADAISAVLSEAEKRQVHAADVKHWLTELREAVYDVDDLLDDFSTEALRRRVMGGSRILKEVRIFFSSSNRLFYRFKMAHQVKAIRRKLDAIADDRSKYNFTGTAHPVVVAARKIREGDVYTFVRESDVIGRDIDKQNIIDFLMELQPVQNVSVLAIVGIGGIGKTALAKLVFNDKTSVQEQFEVKLWACVSDSFDLKTILMKLLEYSSNGRPAELGMNELITGLRGKITRKRFLLVLDDVWNENRDKWLELETLLRDGANGSKILVTTRNHSVARAMGAKSYPLQGLSENEALSLLMHMASKQDHEWKNGMLEAVGKEIVQKCRHVPLAIRTIGRMLARTENTEADWIDFKTRELSKIDAQEDTDILPTLKLSYDSLQSHLKQCFAYCSLFPKDTPIQVDDLIHLWIAQGFVPSFDNTETPEDVGRKCFRELVWRSFFQDLEEDNYGNILRCKMHDLMHDLAKLVVGNDCVIISNARDFIYERPRHIYVDDEVDFEQIKGESNNMVRSFLLINPWEADPYHLLKTITSHFKNLRALRLRLKIVPESIGKMKHLRFLNLSWNVGLVALPNSIGDLPNLETLNLFSCWQLRELPRGITKLINLRNLDIGLSTLKFTHMPKGISRLTSLQVLSNFVVGEEGNPNAAGIEELSKLQGLKWDLAIEGLWRLGNVWRKWDESVSLLQNLKLRSLEFSYWDDDREVSEELQSNQEAVLERLRPHSDLKGLTVVKYRGRTFPAWLASQLHQLVKLEIKECNYCKRLPPVHQLPSLKVFNVENLVELEFIEDEGSTGHSSTFFPSLERLTLLDLPKFKGWERTAIGNSQVNSVQEEQQHDDLMIPMLPERIVCNIHNCPRFSYMSGQHLSLWNVTEKAVQQLERTSKDHAVPSKDEVVKYVSFLSIYSVPLNGLKSLYMENTCGIQVLQEDFYQSLPSLQRLAIRNWPDLKNLSGRVILKHLPALTYLEISSCPHLDLSSDEEEDDVQLLQQDPVISILCEVRLRGFDSMDRLPGWIRHLSELQKLYIDDCGSLKVLGEEVICSLGSLKELEISSCHGLKSLSRRLILHLLTTLESLTIKKCGDLDLNAAESDGVDNEANLPLCGPTTLRKLTISNNSNLVVFPWWIECLSNLEDLQFHSCQNMKELPEWFAKLTSLGMLWISDCGELSRRCSEGGEDKPKISHMSLSKCIVF